VLRRSEFETRLYTSRSLDSRLRGNDPPEADRGFGGVPSIPNSLESPFSKGGLRGLKLSTETLAAGFASLYAAYNCDWIPSHEGHSTLCPYNGHEVCRGAEPLCRESEGVPQVLFSVPPRMGARGLNRVQRLPRLLLARLENGSQ
jgi:hypothetical protein